MEPRCVLDFYVHESAQRFGIGSTLFDEFLTQENKVPARLAYDRPSDKFLHFLAKRFQLRKYQTQNNNFVVFDDYWKVKPRPQSAAKEMRKLVEGKGLGKAAQARAKAQQARQAREQAEALARGREEERNISAVSPETSRGYPPVPPVPTEPENPRRKNAPTTYGRNRSLTMVPGSTSYSRPGRRFVSPKNVMSDETVAAERVLQVPSKRTLGTPASLRLKAHTPIMSPTSPVGSPSYFASDKKSPRHVYEPFPVGYQPPLTNNVPRPATPPSPPVEVEPPRRRNISRRPSPPSEVYEHSVRGKEVPLDSLRDSQRNNTYASFVRNVRRFGRDSEDVVRGRGCSRRNSQTENVENISLEDPSRLQRGEYNQIKPPPAGYYRQRDYNQVTRAPTYHYQSQGAPWLNSNGGLGQVRRYDQTGRLPGEKNVTVTASTVFRPVGRFGELGRDRFDGKDSYGQSQSRFLRTRSQFERNEAQTRGDFRYPAGTGFRVSLDNEGFDSRNYNTSSGASYRSHIEKPKPSNRLGPLYGNARFGVDALQHRARIANGGRFESELVNVGRRSMASSALEREWGWGRRR